MAVNVFLFFKYRERQVAIQEQAKVAQDIQRVQQEIAAGVLQEMEPAEIDQYIDQLETEGVAEEAIAIVEEEKSKLEQILPLTEEEKLEEELLDMMVSYDDVYDLESGIEIIKNIKEKEDKAIPALINLTKSQDKWERYKALKIS